MRSLDDLPEEEEGEVDWYADVCCEKAWRGPVSLILLRRESEMGRGLRTRDTPVRVVLANEDIESVEDDDYGEVPE